MKNKKYQLSDIIFYSVIITLALGLPNMGFAGTTKLPKTGQTKCYDTTGNQISCVGTGQDGEIQAGVAWPNPRFNVNGDGTITDNLTGLMWTKNANLFNGVNLWYKALDYIGGMNTEKYQNYGYEDWRLPNVNELKSLIDYDRFGPSLSQEHPFSNASSAGYWTSSSYACTPYCPLPLRCAWEVDMSYGNVDGTDKSGGGGYFYVWPVRESGTFNCLPRTGQITSYYTGDDGALQQGVAWPNPRFNDNGDGTITDNLTGLMWTKNANLSIVGMPWQQALGYVDAINYGSGTYGYTDWRLPNIIEIKSLTNTETINSADWLNGLGFINVQPTHYWSSTSFVHWTVLAWTVEMRSGSVFYGCDKASYSGYVWPVRTVESIQTLIKLSSFTAAPKAGRVTLQWNTESEIDNTGFNLYRAESENGPYTKINASLITAKGSSTQGASYEFTDKDVQNRKTYYYKLEDIDLNGTSTFHGPVSATPRLIYGIR